MPAAGRKHINTLSTVVCRQSMAVLVAVVINTRGQNGNRLTLYDSVTASGPILAIIDTTAMNGRLPYDVICATGLTAVLDTGAPADVLVIFE